MTITSDSTERKVLAEYILRMEEWFAEHVGNAEAYAVVQRYSSALTDASDETVHQMVMAVVAGGYTTGRVQ